MTLTDHHGETVSRDSVKDHGLAHSIYFNDPNGLRLELACYKFVAPHGYTEVDVLRRADTLRRAEGAYNIGDRHLADAIEALIHG